jgi:hypothetical protein
MRFLGTALRALRAACVIQGMAVVFPLPSAHPQNAVTAGAMPPSSAAEASKRRFERYVLVARGEQGQPLRQLPSSNQCGVSGGWLTFRDGWWYAGDTVVAGCKRVSPVTSTSTSGNGSTHLVTRIDSGPIVVRGRSPNDTIGFLSLVLPAVLPQSYSSVGILRHDSLVVTSVNLGGESIYRRLAP